MRRKNSGEPADGIRWETSQPDIDGARQDKAELDRFSPVMLASALKAPVLLVHGKKTKSRRRSMRRKCARRR